MSPGTEQRPAVVLLSGGLDSATVLALAQREGFACHALCIHYGQRHQAERLAARRVAEQLGCASFRELAIDLRQIGGSALTDEQLAVPEQGSSGIPITYVPARNTIFLSLAMGLAEVLNARDIYIGVNAVDYSGYPDCRPEFIAGFKALSRVATKQGVESGQAMDIHAPLIAMSKAQIIAEGTALGVNYALTVSCYQASTEGLACGRCDSCRLRREGFAAAKVSDPTQYQSRST